MPFPTVPFLAASTLALLMAGVPGNVSAQVPARDNSRFVEVPGGRLWVASQGSGTPLVLLHDGLLPSETWESQVPVFSRSFRVIRYDRRGHGRSEPPQGPYSDVADLVAIFDALKLERAVLAGCSNGGKIAVDFALAHPNRVEALVLAGPVVSGLPFSEHFRQRGAANYAPYVREKSLEKLVDAWVRDPYLMDPANVRARERLRELLIRHPGSVTGTIPPGQPEARPAIGRLGEIRVPTLLVTGASDIADVHAHMGALEAGIPGARRVVLDGAGHLAHMEIPERFNETVLGFLRPSGGRRDAQARKERVDWLAGTLSAAAGTGRGPS